MSVHVSRAPQERPTDNLDIRLECFQELRSEIFRLQRKIKEAHVARNSLRETLYQEALARRERDLARLAGRIRQQLTYYSQSRSTRHSSSLRPRRSRY